MSLSIGHLHRRHQVFSSICSDVTVMGLHQCSGVVGDSSGFHGEEGLVGVGLGQVVGVDES